MTQANFGRFLADFVKLSQEYRDDESINFEQFRTQIAASLNRYCSHDSIPTLVKLAIYASECNTLEEVLAFCKIKNQTNEYYAPF